MKKLLIIAITLFFMVGYTANGQTNHDHNKKQDTKQSMTMQKKAGMQEMTNKEGMCPMCGQVIDQEMPMKKYVMMANQLPKMQQQLSLSENQLKQLNDIQASFKKQELDLQSELKQKQMKLKGLLDEMAPANQIEKQLQECANTRISMGVAAYEAATKMKAVLNNDQKELLKSKMMQQNDMMNHDHDEMMKK